MRLAPVAAVAAALLGAATASAQPAGTPPAQPPPGMPPAVTPGTPPAGPLPPGVPSTPGAPPGAMQPMPSPPPSGMPPAPPGAAPPMGQPGPPPAGYPGYPPQAYGAQPYGYGPPQGYYPQPYYYPPPINMLPPATLPYEEGEAVPPGYRIKTRVVRSMVIAGAVTFGSTYLVSLLTGATVLAASSRDGGGLGPLFAPLVGPFITIGTSKSEGAGTLWLVLDGVAQTAGAVMLIYGLAANEKVLQRGSASAVDVLTHPLVLVGPGSTTLRWTF